MLDHHRFFRPLLLSIPFLSVCSWAILAGEPSDWKQNGFLAKILARSHKGGEVKSCTGTLVSASLVLTSGHCVVDTQKRNETDKRKMAEFVVTLPAFPSDNEESRDGLFRSTAKLLAIGGREWDEAGGWALLRIVSRRNANSSKLNFRPSPNGPPKRINVTLADLSNSKAECQLIGFSTSEKAEDFLTAEKVFRLHLKEVAEPPSDDPFHHFRSRVYGDNFTACYDDVGAPLLCKMASFGGHQLQLGLFQSLTVPSDNTVPSGALDGIENCRKAREMRFTLLTDDRKLTEAIQRYATVEFVEGYRDCA